MFDSGVSTATIARSVDREGKRWGLHARVVRGQVKVCDSIPVADERGGMVDVGRKQSRILCTVDEDAPFSEALACRVRNGETNMAARYEEHNALVEKEEAEMAAEASAPAREAWKNRKRVRFVHGLYIPNFADRERRRLEEAIKRRQG